MHSIGHDVEEKVLERFYSGQTNINKLAKEFSLCRDTIYRIVQSDPERYEQVITRVKNEAKKGKQQRAAKGAKLSKELISAICQYFWSIKCTDDDWGICSEIETAKHFQISQAEVIKALKTDPEYRELEKHREFVVSRNMGELHRQDTAEMSKHSKLSGMQAVMLNRSVYRLSKTKKSFVYEYNAARPWDMPKQISTAVQRLDICKDEKQKVKSEEWESETEQQAVENCTGTPGPKDPKGGGKKKKKKHKKKK
jgi:hypothetical protein